MDTFKTLFRKELMALIKLNQIWRMIAIASFLLIVLPFQAFSKLKTSEVMLTTAIDFYFTYFSIMVVLLIAYSANYEVFFQDKVRKNLEALLVTPVNLKQIWFSKTLAIFLVGYVLSIILSFVFLIILHYSFHPATTILPSVYSYVSMFIINPILCVGLIGIYGLLTLLLKDEMKIRIGFFGLIFGLLYFMRPNNLALGFQMFPFYLIILVILMLLCYIGVRFLNNERIILTSD